MTYTEASKQKYHETMAQKYGPDWRDTRNRIHAAKGGRQGTGHKFAHGAVKPEIAGKLGGRGKKRVK